MTAPALTDKAPFGSPNRSYLGSPHDVTDIANAQLAATQGYLTALTQAAQEIIPPVVQGLPTTGPFPVPEDVPEFESEVERPEDVEVMLPSAPTAADLTAVFPTFSLTPPDVYSVTIPEFDPGVEPAAPGINVPSVPNAPTITLPAPPALLALNIAGFDGVNIPAFDGGELPTVTLIEPTITPYVPGALYTSALLETLKTTLRERIENGGTGLRPEVEQALWDRARERELRGMQDALDDLERMETMGFAYPPGVYADARIKIQTEFGKTTAGLSRDIAIKQAELELANVQDAIKVATQLEGQLMDYINKTEQRLFEAARYTTEAGVQIYNARVEAYKALLDAYRTKVTIYDATIRAEISKVEAYKAQIAAEQAKADINTSLVNQYRVAADVALANVEIFKAQIQAVQASADVERTRVAMYGEQVRAYATRASAFSAQMEGYRAQAQIEAAKQEGYANSVRAYSSQVEAAAQQLSAKVEAYKAEVQGYAAQWDGVRAQATMLQARMQAYTSELGAEVDIYKAQVQGVTSINDTTIKAHELAITEAQGNTQIAIAAAKMTGDLSISSRQMILEASKTAAQVAAQLGAAALNAFNWSNSLNSSESFSYASSNSNSTSTNTNYNL